MNKNKLNVLLTYYGSWHNIYGQQEQILFVLFPLYHKADDALHI